MSSRVAEANHTEKEESLRLAIAVSLLRSKIQNHQSSSSTSRCDVPSESDALRWKQKVKPHSIISFFAFGFNCHLAANYLISLW